MLWANKAGNFHLLASIHLCDQARKTLYQEADAAYRAATRITFEHDLMVLPSLVAMDNAAGTLLSQQLPSAVFANAAAEWARLGLDPGRLEQLRPWAAALCIAIVRAMQRGLRDEFGVDKPLQKRAVQDGKAIALLEGSDEAVASLASGPLSEQLAWLEHVAGSPRLADGEMDDLIDSWHRCDGARLEALLANLLSRLPVTYGNAITRRNHLWLPALLEQGADSTRTLAVVGAFHCVGVESIPTLLEGAGMPLSRVA